MAARAGGGTPWSIAPDGLRLSLRLTPKAARDGLDGTEQLSDGRIVLKVRVRAVPEAGKANTALIRLVAEALEVAAAKVTLESGAGGRLKTLHIAGDGETLAARIAALAAAASAAVKG